MAERDEQLLARIRASRDSGKDVTTDLQTDDRVLARISDGIYRQPASALRELIANAYDADATRVLVKTDAPRFSTISVEDDGAGMNEEALVRLIHHIGGSAKRTGIGAALGITSLKNAAISPKGRKLIGKIGIGLFSVAQLTRNFRIITKRSGSKFRLVAEVRLVVFSEGSHVADAPTRTGEVRISSVPASPDEHGTTIELFNIQPPARDFLQSKDLWEKVYNAEENPGAKFSPPAIHVGRLKPDGSSTIERSGIVPWKEADPPEVRFRKLVAAVSSQREKKTANPKLDEAFDRYFQTLWSLSLSLPLRYLNGSHPFDTPKERLPNKVFLLSNKSDGQAIELQLKPKETLRKHLSLKSASVSDFSVIVDGVELLRPLDIGQVDDPKRPPLLFVGKYDADMEKLSTEASGGSALGLESYFIWRPKVVPVDHIGLLVRIADASGTLFDPTYFSYQVAEKVRLRQLSGELFAVSGLDAALNIDRESFNFGHTHAKITSAWVHRSLRQVANAQKRLQSETRAIDREEEEHEAQKNIWKIVKEDVGAKPERVLFVDPKQVDKARAQGKPAVSTEAVFSVLDEPKGASQVVTRSLLQTKVQAIATLLQEYGLWDELDYETQERLLQSLARILEIG